MPTEEKGFGDMCIWNVMQLNDSGAVATDSAGSAMISSISGA